MGFGNLINYLLLLNPKTSSFNHTAMLCYINHVDFINGEEEHEIKNSQAIRLHNSMAWCSELPAIAEEYSHNTIICSQQSHPQPQPQPRLSA